MIDFFRRLLLLPPDFFEIFPGAQRVQLHLGFQFFQGRKLPLLPEEPPEFQGNGLSVQIAVKVQNPALRADLMAFHSGAAAHIGDGGIFHAVHMGVTGINAVSGADNSLGQQHIGCGKTHFSAQSPAGNHFSSQIVSVSQKMHRCFHVACLQLLANIAGGNTDAAQGLLRNDHTGHIPLPAKLPQFFSIALAPMPETEIISADKSHSTTFNQFPQEILPGHPHDLFHNRVGVNGADAVAPQQMLPVCGTADQFRSLAAEQGFGMALKGNGSGLRIQLCRQTAALPQQRLVSPMNAVKKAQGKYPLSFFHPLKPQRSS